MRQSGILAAAGLHALEHHVARLADDHVRAAPLAQGLQCIDGIRVVAQHTNMVFIDVARERLRALDAHVRKRDVRATIGYLPTVRLVTHLDIDDTGLEQAIAAFRGLLV